MIYDVNHITTFEYARPVSVSHQLLRLTPRPHTRQRVEHSKILIEPAPAVRTQRRDYFANEVTYVTVQEPHEKLTIHSSSRVEVERSDDGFLDLGPKWEEVAATLRSPRTTEAIGAAQFCFASPYIDVDAGAFEYAAVTFRRWYSSNSSQLPRSPMPTESTAFCSVSRARIAALTPS